MNDLEDLEARLRDAQLRTSKALDTRIQALLRETEEGLAGAPRAPGEAIGESSAKRLSELSMEPAQGLAQLPRRLLEGVRTMKTAYRALAAGLILVAIVALLSWLMPGGPSSGLVFAEVQERMQTIRSAKFRETGQMGGKEFGPHEVQLLEPGRYRWDRADGRVEIRDNVLGRAIAIKPSERTFTINYRWTITRSWLELIQEVRAQPEEFLGERRIEGRLAEGFHLVDGDDWVIWADRQTKLPVRVEFKTPGDNEGNILFTVWSDFEYDVDVDESVFDPPVPLGYEVRIIEREQKASTPSEANPDGGPAEGDQAE